MNDIQNDTIFSGNEERELFSWNYEHVKERGQNWYIIFISIVIGLVLWAFFTKQYVLGFFVIFFTGVYFFIELNATTHVHIRITSFGVYINTVFYPYHQIECFSIVYYKEHPLYLRILFKNKALYKKIDVFIDRNIAETLRQILSYYLPEDTTQELTWMDYFVFLFKL